MLASPTAQQGRERRASDSDKPESEHVEEAGVSGEETERASEEPEQVEPWELYGRGLKPSSKLLQDARAKLRGTMVAQLMKDKPIMENQVLRAAMISWWSPTPPPLVHTKPAQVQQVQKVQQAQQYSIHQLALGPWVYFSEEGAYPRWVVVPVPQQGNQQLPRVPGSRNVMWKFEPGPPSGWRGLTNEQLYEWAYNILRSRIEDPEQREAMIRYLQKGPLKELMKGIAQPLPPVPAPPATNFYTIPPNSPLPPPAPNEPGRWTYRGYTRPTTRIRQGMFWKGEGDEENQLSGIGTYGNRYGAYRPAEEAEPAVDSEPNPLDAMDGSPPNGLPRVAWPKRAVRKPGDMAVKNGITEHAKVKQTGRDGIPRIMYTGQRQAPAGPPKTGNKGSEPETEPDSEPEIHKSKEHELVTEALEQLKKNHEKHFPQRVLRRIRTWPGDEIPSYISDGELELVPSYSLEHRAFHDRNPKEQAQTAKRAANGSPKQAAGADADSDDNDGPANAVTAGRAKKARTTKKSTTAGKAKTAGTAKTASTAKTAGTAKSAETAAPAQQRRYPKRGDRK
ncbi:hypothetical protein CNMCM5793_009070 [Aspergillus hiratsukae]|uniref:Uncharacterized protein n=1 Tax=Aspergillus hiratsukae TaxID=1194566 RepID=A0A8H6Q9J9_9EURO|nr:hypothetical protein CNMCM5793_009070 [Aspergillus hiratsukae]KAF7169636.1 hypothetical protein CNMCM6106_004493 [Aspergillus hiratsukae]